MFVMQRAAKHLYRNSNLYRLGYFYGKDASLRAA
ncbi:MAG: hypothetical protein JWP58_3335 [Hymenobacter sp.]|nr:hypothetical protein [Hymenobacter sp.]